MSTVGDRAADVWQSAYVAVLSGGHEFALAAANKARADFLASYPGLTYTGERLPVFRLRNDVEHFYTMDPDERDNAVANYGYEYEGIAFYAFKDPA